MSSRALRRLQRDKEAENEEHDDVGIAFGKPKASAFALLNVEEDTNSDNEEQEEESEEVMPKVDPVKSSQKSRKKKKKKTDRKAEKPNQSHDMDDVDAEIQAVTKMFGEVAPPLSSEQPSPSAIDTKNLLTVEHRFLNADNEMRRIFGSRVVQSEYRRHGHSRTYQKATWLATPRDSWPRLSKIGLAMDFIKKENGCQHFSFVHSSQYQTIQFEFLDAVESFNPDNIAAVLQLYPYHIDSLLQLSEVCKMSEDKQMASELIERALYLFENSFHTLFNLTQGTCRLDYRRAENRAFYYTLFKRMVMVGQRGCYRTALEFCKLLLSLDPNGDPLCVLLMIDFYSLRAQEFKFLIRMFEEWEPHRNLSQLPNWAFSVPLAMFSCAAESGDEDTDQADKMLQNSLLMFPLVVKPMLDKCSVEFNSVVMKHPYFATSSEPASLNQLVSLFVERNHSVWKVPEVLLWLERNARIVCERVDNKDPLVDEYKTCRMRRYRGTPRNIYRHIILSDYQNVLATSLPREISDKPVMMYDPLPPVDDIPSYTRPPRRTRVGETRQNPFSLFLSSLMPSFNPEAPVAQGGDDGPIAVLSQSVRELLIALRGPQGENNEDNGPPVEEVD